MAVPRSRQFFKVVLPVMKPTCVTVAILETMWIWNDYLLPSLVLDTKKYRTIPIAVQYLKGGYGSVDMGAMIGSAGTFYHPDCNLLSVLPKTYYRRCRGRSCEGIRLVRKKGMD